MTDQNQVQEDEAPLAIVLNGPVAKAVRRVACGMRLDAEVAALCMLGGGLGVFMQRMADKSGIDELERAARGEMPVSRGHNGRHRA